MGQGDQIIGHQAGVIGRLTRTFHAMTAVIGVTSDQVDKAMAGNVAVAIFQAVP